MGVHETIMEKHQARRTAKQKTAFIEYMQQVCPELRVEKAGLMGSRNLIYGNPETAEVVFTAHYDTVVVNPLPNLILPYRPLIRYLYMLLVIAPMVGVMLAVRFGMTALGADEDIAQNCMMLAYFIMFSLMFFIGIPSRNTANDNTSGVLALISIMQRLSPEQLAKTAFVFFDNEEYGCVGSGAFYKKHKAEMQDRLIFNMDCVGDGGNLLFVLTEKARGKWGAKLEAAFADRDGFKTEFASAKKVKYPSDQKHFPMSVAVSALHRHKYLKLWVGRIHTRRDTICKKENIEYIAECAEKLI